MRDLSGCFSSDLTTNDAFEVSEDDLAKVRAEFPEDNDLVEVDHPKYRSVITEVPDDHAIELFVNK